MSLEQPDASSLSPAAPLGRTIWEINLLVVLFFMAAGDPPPAVNEAHYLIKAKHFWNPDWLANDLFVSSGQAHVVFYATVGVLTKFFSLPATAWIGRFIGWTLLAFGLRRLAWTLFARPYVSLVIAAVWIVTVARANLAGEWVVGGIEAKVLAYGFVLIALDAICRGRWGRAWVFFGVASAFHVLVGGWSVVAALVTRFFVVGGRMPPREWVCLVAGGGISLVGLLPSLWLGHGVGPADRAIAAQIYAYGRITHHLAPASFPWQWYARHSLLIAVALPALIWLAGEGRSEGQLRGRRLRPLVGFVAAAVGIALCGLLMGVLPALNPALGAQVLRFYWFRMTDAFVPLAAGVAVAGWMLAPRVGGRLLAWTVAVVCGGVILSSFVTRVRSPLPPSFTTNQGGVRSVTAAYDPAQAYRDWRAACQWVRTETPEDAIFITPRHQHTFKWYAGRAEVVNWKDVPQDAESLIEWARRINRVYPQVLSRRHPPTDMQSLRSFSKDFGASYLIVDRRILPRPLPLRQVYPSDGNANRTFTVYELPDRQGFTPLSPLVEPRAR